MLYSYKSWHHVRVPIRNEKARDSILFTDTKFQKPPFR